MDSPTRKSVESDENGRRREQPGTVADKPHMASRSIGRMCNGLDMLNALVASLDRRKPRTYLPVDDLEI